MAKLLRLEDVEAVLERRLILPRARRWARVRDELSDVLDAIRSLPPSPEVDGLRRALDILECMIDDEDCRLDHHGHCQAHGWPYTEPECPNARARALLGVTAALSPQSPTGETE